MIDFTKYDFSFGLEDGSTLCLSTEYGYTSLKQIKGNELVGEIRIPNYEWTEFIVELKNKYLPNL